MTESSWRKTRKDSWAKAHLRNLLQLNSVCYTHYDTRIHWNAVLPSMTRFPKYSLILKLTSSKKHNHSSEANSCLASPGIPIISWSPGVHYRVHKCPPLILILSQSNPVHFLSYYILNSHFKIILPSIPTFSLSSLSFRFSSLQSYTCYMTCLSHLWFHHHNNFWWRMKIMKLLIIKLSPSPCHFIPLLSKCPPQITVLTHCPLGSETKFHENTKQQIKIQFLYL
jgi:hypothetical protein